MLSENFIVKFINRTLKYSHKIINDLHMFLFYFAQKNKEKKPHSITMRHNYLKEKLK